MDTFFSYLKKSLVGTVFIIFAFVITYVPQYHVPTAHAGAAAGGATEVTQVLNNVQLGAVNVATTISSLAEAALQTKDFTLDGLAFAAAKQAANNMVNDLVSWINSGFNGSPGFVQDMQAFLRDTADQAVGEYIENLGSDASFLCEPFRLDIQIALSELYDRSRLNQPAPTCTLTGIIDNIEDFIGGSRGSFVNNGGWNDWFDMTSQPSVYTPYGGFLSAETGRQVTEAEAVSAQRSETQNNNGFLSVKVCDDVSGPGGITNQVCNITKPGKLIQEALSFNLDTGRQSLVEADEINELIGALISQTANSFLTSGADLF